LIWPDASGATTAALAGDYEDAAAHAATDEEALRQLKELLEWRVENEPWGVEPELTEPELLEVKVEVRPQYSEGKRLLPCPETIWLRVPCVTGLQENGLPICVVPHLGLAFNFQDGAVLKGLVGHYVKEALQQLSPMQLASRLPPRDCRLTEIVLRANTGQVRRVPPADRPELKILFALADPLLHDHGRRTASAAYGRDALSSALSHKLGHEKASVLLVGEPGVGKSTLLLDAAKRLARAKASAGDANDEVTTDLRSYRFWRGSGGRIIAGMRYLGEWEERCEVFLQQLGAIDGVFCAENLLELVQVGGQGPGDSVAAFLLSYLQRGELRMTAEATPAEVEACRRLLPGLLDVFQVVHVPAFDDSQSITVLNRIAAAHAAAARLEVAPAVTTLTHRLFKRFQPYAAFPGPAAAFVRSLCERRGSIPLPSPSPPPLPSAGKSWSNSGRRAFKSIQKLELSPRRTSSRSSSNERACRRYFSVKICRSPWTRCGHSLRRRSSASRKPRARPRGW
jgi:ATP-dependent Clp protease ATP-binding subunit ClpC